MCKLLIGALLCMGPVFAQSPFGIYTFKCSTAMVCTDKAQCDQIGVISKSAVSLTPEGEAFRVPLVPCKKSDSSLGVCCRNPDYKDDWPSDYVDPGRPTVTCPPPLIKLPSGKCGNPPTPPPENKENNECKPPMIKLPTGKCGSPPTPPPKEECKLPFIKLPSGKCGSPPTPPPREECKPPLIKLPTGKCGNLPIPPQKEECQPPMIKLPTGKCGNPPTPPPREECKPPLIKLPTGKCGNPPTPPQKEECQPPMIKLPTGKCGNPPTPPQKEECQPPLIKLPTGKCGNPPIPPSLVVEPPQGEHESPGCPRRNRTAMPDKVYKPYDSSDFEAGAGEFPWQGAVFTSAGQFLCVCYNTYNSTCTTTASCVKDYKPSDLKVAVGIYDVADPTSVFENKKGDKNPQISGCNHIAFDPQYDSASGKYDIAILHMANRVKYNYYTKAICLDEHYAIPFFNYDDCVVTGWSDSNTYHYIDVELLSESDCKKAVPGFDSKAMSCAKPNHEVCKLAEFGGGFHCRETAKRNKKSSDVYLLKGTYSAVNSCSPGGQVITFSRIDFDWFKQALYNPLKYPLRG